MFCISCGKKLNDNYNFCIYCGYNLRDNKPRKYTTSFNVAGITYENRQNIIKKIVKSAIKDEMIIPYGGMTNKEIKESGENIFEIEYFKPDKVRLEPATYDNKPAIEVYITYDDKEYMIGYVPKKMLKEITDFLQKTEENKDYKLTCDAYFTGGKVKGIDYTTETLVTKELNYGLDITLNLERQ